MAGSMGGWAARADVIDGRPRSVPSLHGQEALTGGAQSGSTQDA